MQRLLVDIFEYVDPKGRKPVSYTKVMKKYKLTEEQVLEEAGRLNITINPGHFVAPVQETKRGRPASPKEVKEPKGSKGRPKKAKKVLEIEGDEDDLFASLVADANLEEEEVEVEVKDTKEAKRLEKEAKLAADKAEKEAKLAAEKAEKEAKLAAKELEKKQKEEQRLKEKAEKEAKLAADKAEKEAKLAADKAEKEAKLAADKAEKEAKLAAEKEAKLAADKGGKKKKAVVEVEEEEEPDVVKKIEFEGNKYLKSKKTGIIYDYTEYVKNGDQVVVGKWNESKNKIDFTETSEESEEEYEE
jgi:colicin import membrane protein